MSRVRLALFLGLIGLPLSAARHDPPAVAVPTAEPLSDLTGRWRVQAVVFNGEPSPLRELDELVFTARTVEYVSPKPVVADAMRFS